MWMGISAQGRASNGAWTPSGAVPTILLSGVQFVQTRCRWACEGAVGPRQEPALSEYREAKQLALAVLVGALSRARSLAAPFPSLDLTTVARRQYGPPTLSVLSVDSYG